MAETTHTAGTADPRGGFPPFKTDTFPGQIFWLAITFAVLLFVMWRYVVPRIGGTIAERKARIATELEGAETDRRQAERAEAAADHAAQDEIAKAEAELARLRAEAKGSILSAAQDAAIDIVARLTGERVGADEAASAVREVRG
jgi:F-type H+-transporting ATPase subunit b